MSARDDPTQCKFLAVTLEYTIYRILAQAQSAHRADVDSLHNVSGFSGVQRPLQSSVRRHAHVHARQSSHRSRENLWLDPGRSTP